MTALAAPLVISAIVLAFCAGIAVGVMWRESIELLLGRDDPMRMIQRSRETAHAVLDHRTSIATWAVVLTIMLNIAIAGAYVLEHKDTNHVAEQARDQATCQGRYNRLDARARHDRLLAQSAAAKAEIHNVRADIAGWQGLATTLSSGKGTLAELVGVLQHRVAKDENYLHKLVDQQHVRKLHRYPPANYCKRHGGRR